MKIYKPPQRLIDLGEVLQWDKEKEKTLTVYERMLINQERSALLNNKSDFEQPEALATKIAAIIERIWITNWEPENPIKYVTVYY